ncbi:MAG: hypothetical protein DDT42_01740 [candidate division WS2 bacterium]|uniref:Mutator family transposase n=1 Tax=Psychracetigena formicireducens TaxID=2986056 RepID=A0A9E2BHX5_PSYF1|nr:hypothetical protein [Candidatus Psychracetigena formicireducens]MBT9145863.1 hypothetical protein [Candidatus Psychracetigena formicireducens]
MVYIGGSFEKEPVYVALGVDSEGRREILGFWLFGSEGESANLWREIVAELKGRGVKDVSLFVSDDLPGIEEATQIIYPDSKHQLCILHAVRTLLKEPEDRTKKRQLLPLRASFYQSPGKKPW